MKTNFRSHLIVGVDIAKQLHVARTVIVGALFTFENNEDGFIITVNWI